MPINFKKDLRKKPSFNAKRSVSRKKPFNSKRSNSEKKTNNAQSSVSEKKPFKIKRKSNSEKKSIKNQGFKSKKKPISKKSKIPMTDERKLQIIRDSKRNKFYGADKTGAVCIKNLPYGFYESSLYSFFRQFGTITRCKVARSNKNANPMGFAYIEFQNYRVAKIVERTMNNYLMFNKLLKCRFIPHDEIKRKMFSNYNLKKEFCTGTKKKLQNHYKMENTDETALKTKLKRKAASTILHMSEVLGLEDKKAASLLATSSKQAKKKKSGLVKNNSLKQIQASGMENEPVRMKLQTSVETSLKKEKSRRPKENISKTEKARSEIPRTPKGKKLRADFANGETPILMEIDEIDEEIILKTPPNVIKVIKKGAQKILCDETATTIKRPFKKIKIQPSNDIATKLFDAAEDNSAVVKKSKSRKRKNNRSEVVADLKTVQKTKINENIKSSCNTNLKPVDNIAAKIVFPNSKKLKKPKTPIKLNREEKPVNNAQEKRKSPSNSKTLINPSKRPKVALSRSNDTSQNSSVNKSTVKSRAYLKAKSVSVVKNKVKKGVIDFASLLTKEKCENISEGKARAELKKRKHNLH